MLLDGWISMVMTCMIGDGTGKTTISQIIKEGLIRRGNTQEKHSGSNSTILSRGEMVITMP